ncbi:MAG: sugar phosphate isomerase/epimerase [Thermomicrobiales bacterium]
MQIGHTGITWGIPADVVVAYGETAQLGYQSFETFAQTILEWNEKPGGYKGLVERFGIPTSAAYCYKEWVDPSKAAADIESAKREADATRAIGATTLVLQAGSRPAGGPDAATLGRLGEALNTIGAYCREIVLLTSLHPHTGTAIETGDEIDTIMDVTDPALVGFAPDTGQIAKGGSDIVEVLRKHLGRTEHVHLKDWNGTFDRDPDGKEIDRSGYANYEPVGNGMLDMPGIMEVLRGTDPGIWINVELDGTSRAPRSAYDAAKMSRDYLGTLLGPDIAWTN